MKQIIFTQITREPRSPKEGEMVECPDGGFVASDTPGWEPTHIFRREEKEIPDPEPLYWRMERTGEVRKVCTGEWFLYDKTPNIRYGAETVDNYPILKLVPVYEE